MQRFPRESSIQVRVTPLQTPHIFILIANRSRAATITYDFQNLIAIVTARSVVLGDSPEASSQLVVQGRPSNTELRKKLRRRSDLEGYADLVERDIDEPGQWEFDFAEFGAFDAREDILTFE
jgi:hypothetical protein